MQENNFFLSALQPEDGVCSLALPSDQQLDRKSKEAQDSEVLRNARVQEQVRMRMLQKSHSAPRTNGVVLDYELKGRWALGRREMRGWWRGLLPAQSHEGGICFCMSSEEGQQVAVLGLLMLGVCRVLQFREICKLLCKVNQHNRP